MTSDIPTAFLEWRDDWTLEVGFMDEDHRHLAALLNRLARDHGARPEGQPQPIPRPRAPSLHAGLGELAREARQHFHREEEVMRTAAYPELEDHKSDHDLLLAELSVMMRELEESAAEQLSEAALDALKDWLLGHVLDVDRQLADFLKNPRKSVQSPVSSDA